MNESLTSFYLTYSEICGDHCELVLWGVSLHLERPLVLDMERLQRDVGFLIGCSYATIGVHGDNPTIKHIYILYTGDLIEHGCKNKTKLWNHLKTIGGGGDFMDCDQFFLI